jgi:uncharacterized protein YdbL (DUF1318 family)
MKTISIFRCVMLVTLFSAMCWQTVYGQASNIKERMAARLPTIVELKKEGIIGENNKGYLAYVADKRVKQDIVAAENEDRRAVYSAIARQQGTTAEVVGVLRAKQIAEKAQPGEWIQNENGQWETK